MLVIADGGNLKAQQTQILWKRPCRTETIEPVSGSTSSCTPVGGQAMQRRPTSEDIEVEYSQASSAQPNSMNHEKRVLSKHTAIFSSFNSEFVHLLPENTDSKLQWQCTQCNKPYTTNSALIKHQRYYCNLYQKKSFACKYCDKVYMSLGALKMHIRTHTLPCECMICGKAFSRPWLLQGHIRTHTGEKPYKCSSCSRAFADRSNLRAHLQTHSDVKKYKCEHCTKTFSRMSLLLKHQNAGCSFIRQAVDELPQQSDFKYS